MALQLRRGTSGTRTTITPAAGELIYTTDTKLVYVGDGSTAGGNIISGGGGGLTDIVNDTTPQLGGNLDVNGFTITSAGNGNIAIDPAGSGTILLQGVLTITSGGNISKTDELNITSNARVSIGRNSDLVDGNLYITRNSYNGSFGNGFYFAQHHNDPSVVNFNFYRTRGTAAARLNVLDGDKLAYINFTGYNSARIDGAVISVTVEGTPSVGRIPTKISFDTDNGASLATRAELSATGTWKVNTVTALTTNQNLSITANGTGNVSLDGTVFKSSTMTMPPLTAQPTGAAGMMAVCNGTTWNGGGDGLQHLMIYINSVWTVVV
jgi:hypothetical protein